MGNTVRTITDPDLDMYRHHLESEEKSRATTEKYIRDVKALKTYIGNQSITKGLIIAYKNHLQNHYKATSINSMLAGINSFLTFMGWQEYRVKQLRIQRQPYSQEEKELSRAGYFRLLDTAKKEGKKRLNAVHCKNKTRVILIPAKLRLMLLGYSRNSGITKGKIHSIKAYRANSSSMPPGIRVMVEGEAIPYFNSICFRSSSRWALHHLRLLRIVVLPQRNPRVTHTSISARSCLVSLPHR